MSSLSPRPPHPKQARRDGMALALRWWWVEFRVFSSTVALCHCCLAPPLPLFVLLFVLTFVFAFITFLFFINLYHTLIWCFFSSLYIYFFIGFSLFIISCHSLFLLLLLWVDGCWFTIAFWVLYVYNLSFLSLVAAKWRGLSSRLYHGGDSSILDSHSFPPFTYKH